MTSPNDLRQTILEARDKLSAREVEAKSVTIADRILALPEIEQSSSIFLYVSFRSEVDTRQLLKTLLSRGKSVSVPITYVKEKRLDAIRISNPEKELIPGYCNIPEPCSDILVSNYTAPETIDTIILPGSVFDERCGRFGYGGGFYDRFVAAIPEAHRVGLAFDLQVIERAPLQDHDELLDVVVTESRVIRGDR